MIGTVIDGDFEVVRLLGGGSHADVYQASQRSVGNRTVALKILSRLYLGLNESDVRRAAASLLGEADLLGGLHAACFVDVYRTGVLADKRPYIALEFAEGKTLASLTAEGERLPLAQVVDLLHQWAEGLAELHARGWVHRDLTPANVAVSETVFGTQRIQTYDFGTATQISSRADRHRVGYDRDRPAGTPAYMSPEQAAGGVVDGRSDQYALAAIAYELLTGLRPLVVETQGAAAQLDALRGTAPIPSKPLGPLRPDLPKAVEQAIHTALDRDPDRRHASVQRFVQVLERAARGVVEAAPSRWPRWLGALPFVRLLLQDGARR